VEQNEPAITFTDPGDIAFKEAMNKDLSFGLGEGRTQMGAVRAWEELIKRDDISDQQRLFATWRMGCLLSGNFDPERGESPDFDRSEKLLKKAMNMIPGLLCNETINSATLYGTLPGTALEKANRLAESYRFLKTTTQKMYSESATYINKNGRAIDKKFFDGIARLPDPDIKSKKAWIEMRVDKGQKSIEGSITEFLGECNDELAAKRLLILIEDVSDEESLSTWKNIESKFKSKWATEKIALETLEDLNNEIIRGGKETTKCDSPAKAPQLNQVVEKTVDKNEFKDETGSARIKTLLLISMACLAVLILFFRYYIKSKS
jgi:hypothetical protein